MKLNYKKLGTNGKPVIILHGLFGALDNWLSFGKSLSEDHIVYLVDQRNHGKSPHSDNFTYEAMAEDLHEFIKDHSIEQPILIGHSLGGKTVMKYAVNYTDTFEKLIVIDISPKAYPLHHEQILKGLNAIKTDEVKSRQDADTMLKEYVDEPGVRQFLLKNLDRTANGFQWKINLKGIEDNIENVGEGLEERLYTATPALFIRGEKSDYIRSEDSITIVSLFSNAEIKTIEDAGHWVHAEQPQKLLEMIKSFIG